MDKVLEKLLNNVNNLDQYISVTEEIMNNSTNMEFLLNLTTALAVIKVRAFEIEFFNKSRVNGAAFLLFERLLCLPPSKTWGMMNKELISSLQYWLQAIKKRLPTNNDLWWRFLKLVLNMIKDIRGKDLSMPDKLVELTADTLLDLATTGSLSAQQKHEILHCLNLYCAESGREIRLALKNKFSDYFTTLARLISLCGYLPLQFSILETLIRWLVPRGEPSLRAAAAERWFPASRCPDAARYVFLHSSWIIFFQDARRFLNALNDAAGLVTSVLCKRFSVGETVVISGAENQQTWLDINTSVSSVSVLMDPRVLQCFGDDFRSCETLVIEGGSTCAVRLHSENRQVTLSVSTSQAPRVQPCGLAVGDDGDVSITIIISSRTDLRRLDSALRAVFGDNYQVLMDLDVGLTLSPIREPIRNQNSSSEESRFSHPVEVKRRRQAGCGVAYKNIRKLRTESLASPSSTSTTSLALLQNKLATLPRHTYKTNRKNICLEPELSSVTEISETDDIHSSKSTLVFAPFGVGAANYRDRHTKKKAESDSELFKQKQEVHPSRRKPVGIELSTSCLLVATLGNDDSIINDTVERISKNKDFQTRNIVDLIVQEAFEANIARDAKETQENEENSEAIENTPIEDNEENVKRKITVTKKKPCTIISKSTTDDESNTEAILETPAFVNPRRSKLNRTLEISKESVPKKPEQSLNDQNVAKAKTGVIEISPTLLRKDVSTSYTSESFDDNCLHVNYDINVENDVIDCLNDIVDKVCNLFQYLSTNNHTQKDNTHDEFVNNKGRTKMAKVKTKPVPKPKKNIKLTFNTDKEKKPKSASKKNQTTKNKSPKKMSTIIERNDEEIIEIRSPKLNIEHADVAKMNNPITNTKDEESPAAAINIAKRKRKLYSPKDDEINKESKESLLSDSTEDNIDLAALKGRDRTETPKTTATCYKELEKERRKHIRLPRSRKSRNRFGRSPSPRKLNDDVFDKLRSTVENETHCNVVDPKSTDNVYNFSSGSEDTDFELKKIAITKRVKANKFQNKVQLISSESSLSANPGKQNIRRNNTEKSNVKPKNTKQIRKKTKRTNKSKVDINIDPIIDLDPEKMRSTELEILNTSIVTAKPNAVKPVNVDFVSDNPPQMELITDDQEWTSEPKIKRKKLNKNTKSAPAKDKLSNIASDNDNGTLSPLPGLIIEAVSKRTDDTIDFSDAEMERKFQQIQENELNDKENFVLSVVSNIPENPNINKNSDNKTKVQNIKGIKENTQNKNMNNDDVIEIPDTFNVQSDESISTGCICAYANSDDHPPSPGLLDRTISPRETIDMIESMKKCFVALNREVCRPISRERRESLKEDDVSSFDARNKVISRLTPDSSPVPSNINIHETPKFKTTEQEQKRKVTSQNVKPKSIHLYSPKEKLPIISITPLSCEEIERWSTPSFKSRDQSETAVSSKNDASSPKFVYNTRKKVLKNITISDYETSDTECKITQTGKNKGAIRKNTNVSNSNNSAASTTNKRNRSFISPINIVWKSDQGTPRREREHKAKVRVVETVQNSPIPCTSSIELPRPSKVLEKSNPTEIIRKPFQQGSNRLVVEGSRVQDWFRRNDSEQDFDSLGPIDDVLKSVMEKLDTCLVESNQNTSKKFVEIFMEVQLHVTNQRNEIRAALTTALQRFDDTSEVFMKDLQKRVLNVIRQDRTQKELLENALRDEIQAALDHIESMKSKRS